jgi:anti-anti-sigma factor
VQSRPSAFDAKVWIVLPEGRLDAQAAPNLDRTLASLEAQGHSRVLLDLHLTTYVSSSSLRILLIYARRLRQRGGGLKVCCMPARVVKVLCMAGFDRIFEAFTNEELAVHAFSASAPAHAPQSDHHVSQ